MQEPHIEGLATRDDPEPCIDSDREGAGEASAGARPGPVWSREITYSRAPTPLSEAEGHTDRARHGECSAGPARSETRGTGGTFLRENREIPVLPGAEAAPGRAGKADGRKPAMDGAGKSDRLDVPTKSPNKAGRPAAEEMEGRSLAKGKAGGQNALRTQGRGSASSALDRVREAAKRDKGQRFTALLHHVDAGRLDAALRALKKDAAPGVDAGTWEQYSEAREANLHARQERLHQGGYRASPSRRAYIPKADGRRRPLGIAVLEDKIVQRAVGEVLNAIYEADFLGFSYGFRPGRRQHDALDALATGIQRKHVHWVLDADLRGFFDSLSHGWLVKCIEHRIGDRRIVRLIQQWLSAGVMEDGAWTASEVGTPQGASISPLMANIYLHYVLDLWIQQWRRMRADGEVVVVRFADDFIVGFERRGDAGRFLTELRARLAKFQLELHPDKTRLIEFGRFAVAHHRGRGGLAGKPETFNFLGFTHISARNRVGWFLLRRRTMKQRLRAKLQEVADELRQRRHQPIPEQGRWLASVVRGHIAYFGVPSNRTALDSFRRQAGRSWYRALKRRGQRSRLNWTRMRRLINRWLPPVQIVHPWPQQRFDVRTRGKSPVR